MLGRPLRRRLSECPSCESGLSTMGLARATSRHVCFMSRQTARSQRLPSPITEVCPNEIPTKLVSLVVLGRISRHFVVHFEKNPNKKVPQVQALCLIAVCLGCLCCHRCCSPHKLKKKCLQSRRHSYSGGKILFFHPLLLGMTRPCFEPSLTERSTSTADRRLAMAQHRRGA